MKKEDGRKKMGEKISICLRTEGQRAQTQGQPKWGCQRHTRMAFSVEEESKLATWSMVVCFRAKVHRTWCIENEAYHQRDLLGFDENKKLSVPKFEIEFLFVFETRFARDKNNKREPNSGGFKAAWMCTYRETFQRIMCMRNVNARYHYYQTLSAGWMVFNLFYFQCFLSFSASKSFKFCEWIKTISDISTNFADVRRLLLLLPPTLLSTHTYHTQH